MSIHSITLPPNAALSGLASGGRIICVITTSDSRGDFGAVMREVITQRLYPRMHPLSALSAGFGLGAVARPEGSQGYDGVESAVRKGRDGAVSIRTRSGPGPVPGSGP